MEALEQYGMSNGQAELIRHNENMTYCIDGRYLLRIHKSKEGFDAASYYTGVDMLRIHESELRFLEHLKESGVYVQSPVENRDHQLVTRLKDGTVATMLTWLPGRIVCKDDLTEEFGKQLGYMLGKMHMTSVGYPAEYFIQYDQSLCHQLSDVLGDYYQCGKLERCHYDVMSGALQVIGNQLKASEAEYILLHSDLSLTNILITDQGLAPIDFSLLGYSNRMLDLGSVYCFISNEKCRNSVVHAYEQITGITVDTDEIKYYFALQILLGIILHYELWRKEEWFAKRLPEWCRDTFLPLTEKR